jgi:predicted transcriptional regulator
MTTPAEMKSWEEIKALFAETDRRFKETDRRFQETEAQMRETDRKMREVFARFDNLSRRFGDLGNRLGEFVEAMVEPALVELYRARGLDVSEVYRRVTSRCGGERIVIRDTHLLHLLEKEREDT